MKITKQNKMLLGVGAIAIATYLVFKNKKKSFANAGGRNPEKTLLLDLYVGNYVANACAHTVKAPIGYFSSTPPYLDAFVVGKRWFTNFEKKINYPNGIYSLYNPSFSSSVNNQWAKIVNGVVTEVGTCGGI